MGELTQPQLARLATLTDDHTVVAQSEASAVVKRPDGGSACGQSNGGLVATGLLPRVQSYLCLERC
jgi:anti-sigma-K factor RskA